MGLEHASLSTCGAIRGLGRYISAGLDFRNSHPGSHPARFEDRTQRLFEGKKSRKISGRGEEFVLSLRGSSECALRPHKLLSRPFEWSVAFPGLPTQEPEASMLSGETNSRRKVPVLEIPSEPSAESPCNDRCRHARCQAEGLACAALELFENTGRLSAYARASRQQRSISGSTRRDRRDSRMPPVGDRRHARWSHALSHINFYLWFVAKGLAMVLASILLLERVLKRPGAATHCFGK